MTRGNDGRNIKSATLGVAAGKQEPLMNSVRKTLSRPEDLVAAGLLPRERLGAISEIANRYALSLTPDVAELIDPADPRDPIARQFIPDPAELDIKPQESADPIGDGAHSPLEGIVHRYPDRVLLKPLHVCAVYCRFCFRREMVGRRRALSRVQLDAALAYIRAHREIWEVILTGGDPLVLSPRRLAAIVKALAAIRNRACQDHPRAYPRAGGGACASDAFTRARSQGRRQGDLCGAARQPRTRVQPQGAGRVRPFDRCRHPHAESNRVVARRERRCAKLG